MNYYKLILIQCIERIIYNFPFSPQPFPHSGFPDFLSSTPPQDLYPGVKGLEHEAGYSLTQSEFEFRGHELVEIYLQSFISAARSVMHK